MIVINKVHKIRLRPTSEQEEELRRACAAARHAYNFGVEMLHKEFDEGRAAYKADNSVKTKFTHHYEIKKIYNKQKPKWMKGTGTATQEAFNDLGKAVRRFWDIKAGKITIPPPKKLKNGKLKLRKDGRDRGWLTFRNWRDNMSFRQIYGSLKVDGYFIQYSKEVGPIRMCEEFRFPFNHPDDAFTQATFSFDGIHWYASIGAKFHYEELPDHPAKDEAVGVDLGIKYLASTSDGGQYENPKAFYKVQQKLRRLQRKLDRMRRANNRNNYNSDGTVKAGPKEWVVSNRMKNVELEIKKLYKTVTDIRANASHQLTARLTNDYGIVCLEDLNISGMMKNRRLAKAVGDAAMFEKRRQFDYKTKQKGGVISLVDRWYASSKTCNSCGWINVDLKLSDREWVCQDCGTVNERDENAALNIRDEGIKNLAPRSGGDRAADVPQPMG